MKPTLTDERAFQTPVSIFDEIGSSPLVAAEPTILFVEASEPQDRMDLLLASIKWIFLFLPGATAMHYVLMIVSLSVVSGMWFGGPWVESIAAMVIFSFMVLLGLGRLGDIRYLKVLAAIVSSGIMCSVVYNIAAIFIGYKTFGWAALITLPVTILFAHIAKAQIDNGKVV